MIGELKAHSDYKHSEHEWIGAIPAHWNLLRAKYIFREVDERSTSGKEELLSVSHLTGVTPRRMKAVTMFLAESNVGHKICRPNDLVINTLWAWMGALGVTRHAGIVSPAYGIYRPIQDNFILPAYLDYLLRTPLYAAEYQRRSTGINSSRLRLYADQFLKIPLLVPPLDEQTAIVRFADWVNDRLERAIRAKRRVIALLDEQKRAIIHRAVTRGLDSTATLKPSGIPWLGDIPQHWHVRKARHIGRFLKGAGGTKEDAVEAGVPCVRYGELYTSYQNFIRKTRTFVDSVRATGYTPIRYGDVLFAASGEKVDEIGKSAVNLMRGTAVCGGDIVILRPAAKAYAYAPFLGYAFDSYQAACQKATMCRGTTIKHIYPDELRNLQVCFPPLNEQERIASSLDSNLFQLNRAISHLQREINLFQEYRNRLIAEIVTGKLDVREVAVHLPNTESLGAIKDADDLSGEIDIAEEEEPIT